MMALVLRITKNASLSAVVTTGLLLLTMTAHGQQAMTIEELETFIKEKKEALNTSIEQRNETMEKQKELDAKLAEQESRQQRIEQELRSLCDEREDAEPGSLGACLTEMGLEAN